MPDFVRVTNDDTKPFIYHFNNEKKVIPPGRDMMMPWSLACSLFGDPFLTDRPKKPDRTDALRRARGNFNYELGIETMEAFMERIPKLRLYDMETMQQMHMLLFDPEGQMHAEYKAPDYEATDPVALLTSQVQALTTQLQALLSAQAVQGGVVVGNTLPMVTNDGPQQGQTTLQPQPQQDGPTMGAEWIGNNPFAQRPEDQGSPLFDFAAIATMPTDGPVPDGMAVDPSNAVPDVAPAPALAAPEDKPQDAGVASGNASRRPKPRAGI